MSYLGSLDWNWLDFNPKSFSNDFGEFKHCFSKFTGLVLSRASNRLLASSWVLLEDEAASARLKRCGFCLLPVPGCCPTNGRTRAESWFKSRSLMPLVQLVAWLLGKPSSLSFLLPIILMAGFLTSKKYSVNMGRGKKRVERIDIPWCLFLKDKTFGLFKRNFLMRIWDSLQTANYTWKILNFENLNNQIYNLNIFKDIFWRQKSLFLKVRLILKRNAISRFVTFTCNQNLIHLFLNLPILRICIIKLCANSFTKSNGGKK